MYWLYIVIVIVILLLFVYFIRNCKDDDEEEVDEEEYKNLVKKDISKAREVIKDDLKVFEIFQDTS